MVEIFDSRARFADHADPSGASAPRRGRIGKTVRVRRVPNAVRMMSRPAFFDQEVCSLIEKHLYATGESREGAAGSRVRARRPA